MGKSTKNMTDDGYPIDIYGSVTEHMVIEVEALRAGEINHYLQLMNS